MTFFFQQTCGFITDYMHACYCLCSCADHYQLPYITTAHTHTHNTSTTITLPRMHMLGLIICLEDRNSIIDIVIIAKVAIYL